MRSVIFTALALGAVFALMACKSNITQPSAKSVVATSGNETASAKKYSDTVRIANDSLEYEIIIIDPGFNNWLYTRAKPRGYYAENYMKSRNIMWTTEWNIRARQARYADMYQLPIDYSPGTNYGYEVNYMLFNYLSYFQITNNQKLGGLVPRD